MLRSLIVTMCIVSGATPAVTAAPTPQASQGQASTTRLVPHSGVLTDASGMPLTGTHTVIFTLFDHPEGGTVLWTDTVTVTADARGRYAVYLGAGQLLPLEHFRSEQARWVEASVNGHAGARAMLVAVPYALKAADAETLGGQPVSSFLTTGPDGKVQRADGTALSGAALDGAAVDGSGVPGQIAKWSSGTTLSSSVITETGTNRIGVGLPDPTGAGVVDSVFTIKNLDNNTGFAILNETQQRRFAINTQADGGWLLYDGGNTTWNPGLAQRAGRVGLGAINSQIKFQVATTVDANAIRAETTAAGSVGVVGIALHASSPSTVGVYGYSLAGYGGYFVGPKTYVGGFLGVGTTAPLDSLHVIGNIRVTGCVRNDSTPLAGTCSSDRRYKKNISPFAGTLAKLSHLQPVYFDWRADEFPDEHFGTSRSFGLIAQDVEAILPELVVTDETGYKKVKYAELPFHMLQAIKELKTENDGSQEAMKELKVKNDRSLQAIEELKAKNDGSLQAIKELKTENDGLKQRLERLEALIRK